MILDEMHRLPVIFQLLRSLIDRRKRKGKRTGQFLLVGSASSSTSSHATSIADSTLSYLSANCRSQMTANFIVITAFDSEQKSRSPSSSPFATIRPRHDKVFCNII